MKLIFLLLLTVEAANLRKQTEHSNCEICLNLYERIRNTSFSTVETMKTKAREICHSSGEDETICLAITEDACSIAQHLFDNEPNGCEATGYCSNCKSCGPNCYHCDETCYVTRLFKRFWNM